MMLPTPGGSCRPGAPCDNPVWVPIGVSVLLIGLVVLVWIAVWRIDFLLVTHGWETVRGSEADRRRGRLQRFFVVHSVRGVMSVPAGWDGVLPSGVGVVVRFWDEHGVCGQFVDPDAGAVDGVLSRLGDDVAAVTVFTPGTIVDVASIQVTESNIKLTGASVDSSGSNYTLNVFRPDGPIGVVRVRSRGCSRDWWLPDTGIRFKRELTIRVRCMEWEGTDFPVGLAVPLAMCVRVARDAVSGGCSPDKHEGWVKAQGMNCPVPPAQFRSPDPFRNR
jgi:hypothetical protein